MELDKTQIARRQLGTSLALFLEDADPVSVHTLACAGSEIAEHLTRKAGSEPFSTHVLATFSDLDVKDVRRIRNQYWNAFKHATTLGGVDRADEKLLEHFKDEINDHALFVGWYDYMLATGVLPIEAQVFQVWYYARYPEKLNPNVDTASHRKLFPNLPSLQRSDQKRALRAVIATYRKDLEIMNDSHTDRRPLILVTDCSEPVSKDRQPIIGGSLGAHREKEQGAIATPTLDEIAAERGWDERFAKTQDQLGALARSASAELARGGVVSGDPSDCAAE